MSWSEFASAATAAAEWNTLTIRSGTTPLRRAAATERPWVCRLIASILSSPLWYLERRLDL
jgi:hypothetical protein